MKSRDGLQDTCKIVRMYEKGREREYVFEECNNDLSRVLNARSQTAAGRESRKELKTGIKSLMTQCYLRMYVSM